MGVPLGYGQTGRPQMLVLVSGYSRVITARMPPSKTTGDLIDGHRRLLGRQSLTEADHARIRPAVVHRRCSPLEDRVESSLMPMTRLVVRSGIRGAQ
ncbi:hypothetical protein [Streptomyces cellostaticus]|uniref:hypothetical protein n=1 Tax=Streptomyces cellostaticus TaxID=67285 RepID=UPI0020274B0F|nr:hypothetical protein [Streptomyces cellostaticus]